MVTALQKNLSTWNLLTKRGRHDYDSDDHLIADMMNAEYFGVIHWCFVQGDLIFVTDAALQQMTLQVDGVDSDARRVWISVLETQKALPITRASAEAPDPGFCVKWRGPRGGGWSIVDNAGEPVKKEFKSKEEAENALLVMLAKPATEAAA